MTREHRIKTPARTGLLTVTEHADRIDVRLTFDRYGTLGDEVAIAAQLWPLLAPYDSDPRPMHFDDPHFGQRAVIAFDRNGRPVAVVTGETRQ